MAKGTFGERLKRERELREVSLNELTKATRIGGHFLEALENEQWEKLPGGVFNRGFVRAIAHYLGLNEENLLAEYDLAHGETTVPVPVSYESKIPRPPIWIPVVGIAVVLIVLAALVAGGIYGWRRYAAHRAARKSSSSVAVPSQGAKAVSGMVAVASAPPQAQGACAATPLDLFVLTSAAARVRVTADSTVLIAAEMAGESSAVLLQLNRLARPPVGAPRASGTIVLSQKDLRPLSGGNAQP